MDSKTQSAADLVIDAPVHRRQARTGITTDYHGGRKRTAIPGQRMSKSHPDAEVPAGTQSIHRVVMILRELATRNREGARLADLVSDLGLEQPTVHRMLKSLVAESLAFQDPESKRYFLGQAMYEFGLAASQRFDFRSSCGPILDSLARETGDTVFLVVRSGDESVCLDRREGDSPVKLFTVAVGDRRPLGIGASGMALLSAFPEEEIRRVVASHATRLAAHGEPDANALVARLLKAKKLGYAVRDLPKYEGIRAVGMPVFDLEGRPIAALSVSTLSARLKGKQFDERLGLLRQHVEDLRRLTAKGPG